MRKTERDTREKQMGIKEHLRKAMVVLLTVAMVSQQSPIVYAVESYNDSYDNESTDTYENDSYEGVEENNDAENEQESSDQQEGVFDFIGDFFGSITGQNEEEDLEIEVQFGHSYIEYMKQVIAPPASKVEVAPDTEFRFRAYPDSGY